MTRTAVAPGPPLRLSLLALLGVAACAATANYLAFVPWEGATGPMRVHWPWWRTFLVSGGQWLALAPFVPVVARVAAAAPLERGRRGAALLRHLLALAVLSPLHWLAARAAYLGFNALVSSWAESRAIAAQVPWRVELSHLAAFPLLYGTVAACCYAWAYRQRAQARAQQAALLERQLAESKLQVLRMQLNPHFLFNTLNGVMALIRRDPPTAEAMLLALTDFLRATLDGAGDPEPALAQELDLAERYLAIEALRFPGRVALAREVAPEALKVRVPALLLQPLVENAVRHGLAPRPEGGTVRIRGRIQEGRLDLAVEDDGAGRSSAPGGGLGLANTRARLAQRYGGRAALEAGPRPEGGYRVRLSLPLAEPAP